MSKEICTDCNGQGHIGGQMCKACEGFGYYEETDSDCEPWSDEDYSTYDDVEPDSDCGPSSGYP